jgi:RHS repeat-associated protein
LYSETWESGSADGWAGSSGNAVMLATDTTSPAGSAIQQINANGVIYQPNAWTAVQPGQIYCISAYVRWVGGSWPFIGIQLSHSSGATETDWLMGEGSYTNSPFAPLTPISATDANWQSLSHTVSIPNDVSQVQLTDELWNGDTKGGADLAYFDGLSIDSGACPTTAPETVYQQWWESGSSGWTDGNGTAATTAYNPSSPAGSNAQVITQSTSSGPYQSPSIPLTGGATYCVWSSVQWLTGQQPYVGVQFDSSQAATMLVGGGAGASISATDTGWQTFSETVLVPEQATSVRLVDGVSTSGTNAKPGTNNSFFDNMSIATGPCQGRAPSLQPQILPSSTNSANGTTSGRTDGNFGVTDDGSATYRIPLWVPPGRNGVEPHLALAYSSDAGDGMMGLGWHVDGLSEISLCPADYARDGHRSRLGALCFNGERLVLVSGTANQAGAEYRTEIDNFIKIVQVAQDDNQPTGFIAYMPDGTRNSYGLPAQTSYAGYNGDDTACLDGQRIDVLYDNSSSQTSHNQGGDLVRLSWKLAASRDRFDNEITYKYKMVAECPSGMGCWYTQYQRLPETISYTAGPSNIQPDRSVKFVYDSRGDFRTAWVDGLPIANSYQLKQITMSGPDLSGAQATLRSYGIAYVSGPGSRPLVHSVTECDGSSVCKAPTVFTWTTVDPNFDRVDTGIAKGKPPIGYPTTIVGRDVGGVIIGDFNGDGRDDILLERLVVPDNSAQSWSWNLIVPPADVRSLSAWSQVTPASITSQVDSTNAVTAMYGYGLNGDLPSPFLNAIVKGGRAIDFNGDGRADYVMPVDQLQNGTWGTANLIYKFMQSTKIGNDPNSVSFVQTDTSGPDTTQLDLYYKSTIYSGDFAGNGLPDTIRATRNAGYGCDNASWSYRPNMPTWNGLQYLGPMLGPYSDVGVDPTRTDYDGQPIPAYKEWNSFVVDLNGAGAAAFLYSPAQTGGTTCSADGTRLSAATMQPGYYTHWNRQTTSLLQSTQSADSVRYQFADINGDGLADAIEIPMTGGNIRVAINTGRDFLPPIAINLPAGAQVGQSLQLTTDASSGIDPGIRIMDYDMDGRADLILTDPGCIQDGVHPGQTDWQARSSIVALRSKFQSNGPGEPIAFDVDQLSTPTGTIPIGASSDPVTLPEYNATSYSSGGKLNCGGGQSMSQTLDVNGDGLADMVQLEGSGANGPTLVLYIRRGQKPGLLSTVTDGFGGVTQVSYLAGTDSGVYTPPDPSTCAYPQLCGARGKWLVANHTFQPGTSDQLGFRHTYAGGRTDVQGIGWLGMDSHSVTDLNLDTTTTSSKGPIYSDATTTKTYDHITHTGGNTWGWWGEPSIYPWRDRATSVVSTYSFPNANGYGSTTISKESNFNCVLNIQNNYARVGVSSCDEAYAEREYPYGDPSGFGDPEFIKKEKRVHTDYEPNFGYVIDRTTAIGTGSTLTDPSNETTVLTRSGFSTDNADTWIIGHADRETVVSTMPARTSPATPVLTTTHTTGYNYDQSNGVLKWVQVEPDFSGPGAFLRQTTYDRNTQGQIDTITVSTPDGHQRITGVVYSSPGDVFPTSSTISGVSPNCSSSSPIGGECAAPQKTTTMYHSGLGLLMESVDANGAADVRQYDRFGRLRTEQAADGGLTSVQYGLSTSPFDELSVQNGKQSWTFYDERGLLTSVKKVDDSGIWFLAKQMGYEPHGWLSQRKGADDTSIQTNYSYDSLGRLTQQVGPIATTSWGYVWNTTTRTTKGSSLDSSGKVIDQIDSSIEDQAGRIVSRVEEVGAMPTSPVGTTGTLHNITTSYVFGPFNALRDVVDTNKNTIHVDYDTAGRRLDVQDPDTGERTYWHDGFDETTSSSAGGKTQTWSYDVLGRRFQETTREGTSVFVWDAAPNGIGKPSSTKSALDGVTVAYEYDQQGRLSAQTRGVAGHSYRVDLGYDDLGRPNSVTYPRAAGSRHVAAYAYNGTSGELQSISDGTGSPLWQANTRNHSNQVTLATSGDGSIAEHAFYATNGLLWGLSVSGPQGIGSNLLMTLGYDNIRGYLSKRTSYLSGETETFTHDELGRLTHWAGSSDGGWSVHYDYDDIGNMTSRDQQFGSVETKYTYTSGPSGNNWGGPHAVTAVSQYQSEGQGGTSTPNWYTYNYDGLGRQVMAESGGDTRTIDFTDFDLPRTIQDGNTNWVFQYDADRQRAQKITTSAAGVSSTVYVGKLYEKRIAASGDVTHVMYVAGDRGNVVAQITQPDIGGAPVVDYLFGDQLGSTTAISGPAGATQMRFDPFGARIGTYGPPSAATNPSPSIAIGFTGQEEEDRDGLDLINMNGRIYDPSLMRFLTADPFVTRPMNSQEFNRYSYANNSPFSFTDKTGFQAQQDPGQETPSVPPTQRGQTQAPENMSSEGGASSTDNGTSTNMSSTPLQGDQATGGSGPLCSVQNGDDSPTSSSTGNSGQDAGGGGGTNGAGGVSGAGGANGNSSPSSGNALPPEPGLQSDPIQPFDLALLAKALISIGVVALAGVIETVANDAAEVAADQTYEILDGVRRATAAQLTGATTISAEVVDSNMLSHGVSELPIDQLLSPKQSIDLCGGGFDRWNSVLEGTRAGNTLPPILVTPGASGIPISNVTIGP